ncbi:hypothetical protein pkur_cds_27 [Pandoravirus kuranda]|uniref:Uncharacterized protein n=1 Tax=Pandoravirus kuranda TaxID=3019033 RepID=A0AA95J3C2_9VIRU|nr:hypothetical protein pkur_cds_27 [Pandoravirus kuranda]
MATPASCVHGADDAFWRVADTREGDLIALGVLACALLSLLGALVCAIRACALLRHRGDPQTTHTRGLLPPSTRTHQTPEDRMVCTRRQRIDHRHDDSDPTGGGDAGDDDDDDPDPVCSVCRVDGGVTGQDCTTGKECDQEAAVKEPHGHVRSWRDKWKPALGDPEAFAAARLRARKEAQRAAGTTARRVRAQTYSRPLSLDTLVALERTAARVASLPNPH